MVLAAKVLVKEIRMEKQSAPVEIALRDVSVSYPVASSGRKTVLSKLNLDIFAGEFVAVLGETGCGKSTLLRLVLGQEFPTSGSIVVDGKQVTRIDSRCGYVPQKYSLFPDRTMMQNVMYGPENAFCGWLGRLLPSFWKFRRNLRLEAEAQLLRMGLHAADFNKYPHQLSGGMQQRVAIAQALMMKPPVLLMDEAFSALDPSTRASLQQQLREIWQETRPTVLFVTHNTSEALLLGTRLVVLGAHRDNCQEGNVILDMPLPQSSDPIAIRKQSSEFQDLREFVKAQAYGSSSRQDELQPLHEALLRGDSL
ncbi:ABC transporter ATP-binding protein [Acidicapsa acidisoli]|uniref:ABC transporter ATP-binding protein n=1 Tax=Acidicapsa acidisoli TaxID=1615681 RepID=UPI0021DFA8D8|nr:ABC transporter ATP-binding protein [Acidicapsa acidisoli]